MGSPVYTRDFVRFLDHPPSHALEFSALNHFARLSNSAMDNGCSRLRVSPTPLLPTADGARGGVR
jgi:hypothetical protein